MIAAGSKVRSKNGVPFSVQLVSSNSYPNQQVAEALAFLQGAGDRDLRLEAVTLAMRAGFFETEESIAIPGVAK